MRDEHRTHARPWRGHHTPYPSYRWPVSYSCAGVWEALHHLWPHCRTSKAAARQWECPGSGMVGVAGCCASARAGLALVASPAHAINLSSLSAHCTDAAICPFSTLGTVAPRSREAIARIPPCSTMQQATTRQSYNYHTCSHCPRPTDLLHQVRLNADDASGNSVIRARFSRRKNHLLEVTCSP
jgi:hypothetical protein